MTVPFFVHISPKSVVAGAREPIALALVVVRVEEVLGLLAALGAGLAAEEVGVEGRDLGVEVAHAGGLKVPARLRVWLRF